MSNYTITTNFGAKDSLPSTDVGKVIKGSEFTTEFTNIQTAVATKADTAGDTFTGVVNFSADVAVNTNTLFVDVSEGKVGIGTTSPANTLTVGNLTASANDQDATVGIKCNANHRGIILQENSGAEQWEIGVGEAGGLKFYDSGSATPAVTFADETGNVGIGTSSPDFSLSVGDSSDSNNYVSIKTSNTGSAGFLFSDAEDADVGYLTYSHATNHMRLGTNGNERMRIDANGNVGIGTDSPTGDLTIGRNGNASGGNIMLGSATNNTNKYGVITSASYNSSTDTEGFAAIATQGISGTNLVTIGGGIGEVDSATQVRLYTSSASGTRAGTERMRIDSSGNVLVGTTSLAVADQTGSAAGVRIADVGNIQAASQGTAAYFNRLDSDGTIINLRKDGTAVGSIGTKSADLCIGTADTGIRFGDGGNSVIPHNMATNITSDGIISLGTSSERFKDLYLSGNLLVGTTATPTDDNTTLGFGVTSSGEVRASVNNGNAAMFKRASSDGDIIEFRKDSATVGSIGTVLVSNSRYFYIGSTANPANTGIGFYDLGIYPSHSDGSFADNGRNLGSSSVRWNDIYATNNVIQTSDRNEKQGIRELLDAEQRVATACKGLLRAFKWNSSVEEKGDEARIHFGIVAQDLQDAFTAEGLDAGDYAMFINSTWTDEETGEERSRMGVRYSELLAFIISAI